MAARVRILKSKKPAAGDRPDHIKEFYELKCALTEAGRQVNLARLFLNERVEKGQGEIIQIPDLEALLAVLDPAVKALLDPDRWHRAELEAMGNARALLAGGRA
jgi:hypothetical protein